MHPSSKTFQSTVAIFDQLREGLSRNRGHDPGKNRLKKGSTSPSLFSRIYSQALALLSGGQEVAEEETKCNKNDGLGRDVVELLVQLILRGRVQTQIPADYMIRMSHAPASMMERTTAKSSDIFDLRISGQQPGISASHSGGFGTSAKALQVQGVDGLSHRTTALWAKIRVRRSKVIRVDMGCLASGHVGAWKTRETPDPRQRLLCRRLRDLIPSTTLRGRGMQKELARTHTRTETALHNWDKVSLSLMGSSIWYRFGT